MVDINAQDNNQYSVLDYARLNIHNNTDIVDLLLQLNVFDPNRGEILNDEIQIEKPNIKIFQSTNELSSLKTKDKEKKKKKTKSK